MRLIYSPEEDSYLLEKVILEKVPSIIKKNKKVKFLEIGTGSGIQLLAAEKSGVKKENIFGVDINISAVNKCRSLGFKCIKSNLFQFVEEKFDIIVFNPPYLPEDKSEDKESKIITTGGKMGSELINKFLNQAKSHLRENGVIYLLTSSLTKGINFLDYTKELMEEEKLFFEKLFVYELKNIKKDI